MAKRDPKPDGRRPPPVDFGFRRVSTDEKGRLVRAVFDEVAPRYDLMNDLMSAGVHRLWKRAFIEALAPRPGLTILDLAGGTGDIASGILNRLAGRRDPAGDSTVIVCDASPSMIEAGRRRARGPARAIRWLCADAEALPMAEMSVDAVTIAFGLRNVTRIERALGEARRVLRPGGRFLCLEFGRVVLPLLDRIYERYSFAVVPLLGALVARDRDAYQYLVESIRRFPPQAELAGRMERAGLERVSYRNLSGGIAAIHSAWRL